MGALLFAAILGTLHLEGDVPAAGGDYLVVPFDVPAGTVEFSVVRSVDTADTILEFGVWSAGGFRGWGGGLTEPTVIGVDDSSRGYLPGPIPAASWNLVIGKANLPAAGSHYSADLTFNDVASLTPRPRAAFAPTVVATGARWYKGDLHVHDSESGDAMASFQQITDLARAQHLDFVVLSDHNTVSQQSLIAALQPSLPDLLLMRGCEITTYGGHGGGLGISSYVDHRIGLDGRTAAQVIADVNAQGGLFIVNHALLELGQACIGCAWKQPDTPWNEVAGMEIQTGNYSLWLSLFLTPTLALWDQQLDAGARLAAVGGSDDHRAGLGTGASPAQVGTPTTLVWAEELSESAILDGIRGGRTAVALRGSSDPLVELTSTDNPPKRIGDTLTGSRVTLEAHVAGGNGQSLSLFQDGVEGRAVVVDSDDWRRRFTVDVPKNGGRVRAQLSDAGVSPTVVTSHIWLNWAPPGNGGSGCSVGGRDHYWGLLLVILAWTAARRVRRSRRATSPDRR
jgi:hypothetical protein